MFGLKPPSSRVLFAALAIISALIAAIVFRTPDTSYEQLFEKYKTPESTFLDRDDVPRIHYSFSGRPENPTVILLHGVTGNLRVFDTLTSQLEEDFYVVRYDQIGHGFSGASLDGQYGADVFHKGLDALIDELGVAEFALVGHSMGGWISWRYAARNPTRVKSLVLLSPSGVPTPEGTKVDTGIGFNALNTALGRSLIEQFLPRYFVEKSTIASVADPAKASDELVDMFWETSRLPGNRKALAQASIRDRELDKVDLIWKIRAPTLLIWGAEDSFTPVQSLSEFERRLEGEKTLVLPDVGHLPMIEAPTLVGSSVSEFLAGTIGQDHQ